METQEEALNFEHSHRPIPAMEENFKCRRCWHMFPTEGLARKQCPICGRLNRLGEDETMMIPVQR